MNKTKIDWAEYSWNPVTGCLHGCNYCYARKIANRFKYKGNLTYVDGVKPKHLSNIPYPYGFLPTFHPNRLDEPSRKTKGVNIFVCSMADLFGDWVPDEWIKEVFEACEKAPQHRYLFLTKNLKRYKDIRYSNNIWLGNTIARQNGFIKEYGRPSEAKRFYSIEPILEPIRMPQMNIPKWIIV